ncbi:helix-turn-helix transcriptional regulator [Fibrella sp. HMF5335]|uniref:Helix-turn-helix transcriptional regulator n=1 Tax=Fibrella rubiginis TaxID=2817060 RepID=A0A939GK49_9BACT|nr:AraC family transcriptional regulator [Fibrella rubiginis]MBO0938280.1 helix-turn-helix transcriptional regulator [Fibrella rubiginis]
MINVYEFLRYQPELYKQFVCKDLLFVYYDCPQVVRKVDVFTHYNILSFVIDGKKLINRPEKTWLLQPGSCYFFRIGAYNQELYLDEGWCSMNMYIPDKYLQQLIRQYNKHTKNKPLAEQPLEQVTELAVSELTRSLSQTILAHFSDDQPPAEAQLAQYFNDLFLSILDDPANQLVAAYLNTLAKCPDTSLYTVMETSFMYNLSLTEFAKFSNRSVTTFKREFKRIFNMPPAQWLLQKRLDYAEVLLTNTEKSVADIAAESGFVSNAHFSRTFSQKFGASPLHYRKRGAPLLIA